MFEYDAGGRQTKAGAREVDYTDFDMPRSVTIDAVTTDFRHGPGGQRVEKRSPDGRTVYAFGLYEKRETAEGIQHVFFIPGDTGIVAQVTRTEDVDDGAVTEDIAYFTRDHLGSSTAAFNQAGAAEVQLFDPWGERIYHTGATTALMTVVDHGYTDQRHEEDLGWIDMNARMYDPVQRRFISPDPLVADPLFSTGRNRFAYVLNNPLRYTDPTGLGGQVNYHDTWDKTKANDPKTIKASVPIPDAYIRPRYGLNLPDATWLVEQPAPFERDTTEVAVQNPADDGTGSSGVRETVASPGNAMLDTRFASQGGMKDWVDIDPGAVDHRGRPIYECESPTDCKSIKADYIEPPIGTSDVEVQLALGGAGKILGAAKNALGRLLGRSIRASSAIVTVETGAVETVAAAEVAGSQTAPLKAPFNPSGSMTNCVNGVCAFLNSVKNGSLVAASADVAVNHGKIRAPNKLSAAGNSNRS